MLQQQGTANMARGGERKTESERLMSQSEREEKRGWSKGKCGKKERHQLLTRRLKKEENHCLFVSV